MPIIEYKCDICKTSSDHIVSHPIPLTQICETCKGEAKKQLSSFGTYSIKGNNSASITPKKYRGET